MHLLSSFPLVITVIGWCGAAASAGAYGLVSLRGVPSASPLFQGLNLGGSAALSISAAVAGAWPSSVVNMIWFAIGAAALATAWSRRKSARAARGSAAPIPSPER